MERVFNRDKARKEERKTEIKSAQSENSDFWVDEIPYVKQ